MPMARPMGRAIYTKRAHLRRTIVRRPGVHSRATGGAHASYPLDGGTGAARRLVAGGELPDGGADLPVARPRTLEQVIAESLGERRFQMVLLTAFGAIALLLASV